jgi:predicted amidophosphoribosyltransferase
MIDKEQNLRFSTRKKLATNWTLSGNTIEGGIRISGAPSLCGSCGSEVPPYADDFCPSCKS